MPEGVRLAGAWAEGVRPGVWIVGLVRWIADGRSRAELCREPRPTGVWVQNRAAAEAREFRRPCRVSGSADGSGGASVVVE